MMDVCSLETGWEPWITFQCRHWHFGDFGSISAYLLLSAESSCPAGMSSTWPEEGCQGSHCAKGLCLNGAQGELWGSGWILGFGTLLIPGHATHSRRSPKHTGQMPPEPGRARHAGSISEKGRFTRHQAGRLALFSLCCRVEPVPCHLLGSRSCGTCCWSMQPVLLDLS